MNTKNLQAYAPKARTQFIEAIKKRAAHFGIYEDRIAEVRIEGGVAVIEGRAFTRKEGEQRKRLERKIAERTSASYQEQYDMFIRAMAYTWFNRLAALRYMEIHDYFDHGFRVLKPLSNKKGGGESAMDTIRRYFSTQFFKDHCKTYKKRPIYWLFSSGKEKAFECLVYLHRYNEATLSRMRTEYATPLMGKYDAQHMLLTEQHVEATGTEARRIEKDLKSLEKKQAELRVFDEQLKHYAEKRITLDLDDGVKANYGKFGNLLADVKAIHGKKPEEFK